MDPDHFHSDDAASYFPGATVTVVGQDADRLVVALLFETRRRGEDPPLRRRVDLLRPAVCALARAAWSREVSVVVARSAEEVAALAAAWAMGETARETAVRERGDWLHGGGRAAVAPMLAALQAAGRVLAPEPPALSDYAVRTSAPSPPCPKPVGPARRRP